MLNDLFTLISELENLFIIMFYMYGEKEERIL